MKKYLKYLSVYVFALGVIFTSCDSRKAVQPNTEKDNERESIVSDSTRISIDATKVDSMTIIFDNDSKNSIDKSDFISLADAVLTAKYDTRLNSGDIMMKMQAPDYTVIIYNTGQSNEESDWLMVWNEDGRTKFKNQWYYLAEDKKEVAYKLLEKYKENSK